MDFRQIAKGDRERNTSDERNGISAKPRTDIGEVRINGDFPIFDVRSVDGPVLLFPVRSAQLALEHLASRREWERVDDLHRAGYLVRGDPRSAEGAQIRQGHGGAGDGDDDRVHSLAPRVVRYPDDRAR